MREGFEAALISYQKRIAEGMPVEEVITLLHRDGFTILESIAAIRKLYQISLREAKQLVSIQPVWYDFVEAQRPFHEAVADFCEDPNNW